MYRNFNVNGSLISVNGNFNGSSFEIWYNKRRLSSFISRNRHPKVVSALLKPVVPMWCRDWIYNYLSKYGNG